MKIENDETTVDEAIKYLEASGLHAKKVNTFGIAIAFHVGKGVEYIATVKSIVDDIILVIQEPPDSGLWSIETERDVIATRFSLREIVKDVLNYYEIID